jgi:predicted ArsR family transcriptional regulator
MQEIQWVQRVLGSTRGQILALLCRGPQTVSELAAILDLTANGVRGHLGALEADGLVKHTGVRRGVGKPAHVFQLTAGGHSLLSAAYQPVLHALLDVLGDGMRGKELPDLLRQAGRRLAARHPKVTGDLRARAEAGASVLRELGSVTKVEEDGAIFIRGLCCPLAEIVPDHPQVCTLIEALLRESLDVPVRECCDKRVPPRCCFVIRPADALG